MLDSDSDADAKCDAKALMPVPQSTAMRGIESLLEALDELSLLARYGLPGLLQKFLELRDGHGFVVHLSYRFTGLLFLDLGGLFLETRLDFDFLVLLNLLGDAIGLVLGCPLVLDYLL